MRTGLIGLGLVALTAVAGPALAAGPQRRATASPAKAAAAVRTVKGNMRGNVIAVRNDRDQPLFDYVLTSARLADGKLELSGRVRPKASTAGAATTASATLIGSLAKDVSPEYIASRKRRSATRGDISKPATGEQKAQSAGGPATSGEGSAELGQLAQSTQSTARTTPPSAGAEGEKPKVEKQTKATASGIGGCEVVYLRMAVPTRYATSAGSRTVQLNVSLAEIDNRAGVDLNQRICRVVNALAESGAAADVEVAELNRLLGSSR